MEESINQHVPDMEQAMPEIMMGSTVAEGRFEQVLAELLRNEEEGTPLDIAQAVETYPDLESSLREYYRIRAGFDRLAPSLAPTAPRSVLPDLPPGTWIDGYEIVEEIERGGRGIVYRVRDAELNRSLAVKVLLPELRDDADAVRRFLEERQVTGQLQHPGIVPVHSVGTLPDGRPYFAMKLVQGRTLAALLADRSGTPSPQRKQGSIPVGLEDLAHPTQVDLPSLLPIFQQICQAVAYAHSLGVIHRDLKTKNVMVGAFAEVQVMDWGLAKVLANAPAHFTGDSNTIHTVRTGATGVSSTDGMIAGTYAYMSPEQANGLVDLIDERADVFGLGAVLCEMLTGLPPYQGASAWEIHQRAAAGDLADAFRRLESCGADMELIALARGCLAIDRDARPRNAGAVAERVATHLAAVAERLRRAEVEQAAAEARAEEARAKARAERRARRLTLGLAAAVLLLVAVGGSGAWWARNQRHKVDDASLGAFTRADVLREEAKGTSDGDPTKFQEALKAALDAREMAIQAGASGEVKNQIGALISRLEQDVETAERNRRLHAGLLDAHYPPEISLLSRADKDLTAHPAEQGFATAFRDWGLDVDATPAAEAATRLKQLPVALLTEVAAALDDWAGERQRIRKHKDEWQRLMDLATALDDESDSRRRELRAIMAHGQLPYERTLGELSHAVMPLAGLADVVPGKDRNRLRRLADQVDPATAPTLSIYALTRALHLAGDDSRAEQLVRRAIMARPQETVFRLQLSDLSVERRPPKWPEALESLEAARALRPQYGVLLARIMVKSGHLKEATVLIDQLVQERPDNAMLHHLRGLALSKQRRLREAESAYLTALKLKPNCIEAYHDLAVAQREAGRRGDAITNCRKAIELVPEIAATHTTLGLLLDETNRTDEAIEELEKAVELDSRSPVAEKSFSMAHNNLGICYERKGWLDKATAEYHKAMELDPGYASPHNNYGILLKESGHPEEAEKHYRIAIHLDSKYAAPHNNLGNLLAKKGLFDEAIAEYRAAMDLDPLYAEPHVGLGDVLRRRQLTDQEMDEYQKAIALDPNLFQARCSLGILLKNKGFVDAAIEQFRKVIETNAKYAPAHDGLANALALKGLAKEALVEYHTAIELDPKEPINHGNLGAHLIEMHQLEDAIGELHKALELKHPEPEKIHRSLAIALHQRGQLAEAADECRKAIACKGGSHLSYDHLGSVLRDSKQIREAEEAYRQAIAAQHNFADAYFHLGIVLADQKKLQEAEDAYRQAITLKPAFVEAHLTLASFLADQGRPKEAESAFTQAILHNPKSPEAHYSFGCFLDQQGRLKEAEDAYGQAITLRHDYAEAHCNLGYTLRRQGRFAEALAETRRGDELGRKRPDWPYQSARWVREAERLADLDDNFSKVCKDKSQFTKPSERLELADFCREHKQCQVAAVSFYRDAFAADPKLTEDPRTGNRCHAIQAAALAAAGRGKDAAGLDDKARADLRKQALDWLRAELAVFSKLADESSPQVKQALVQGLQRCKGDDQLAGVRDASSLAKLPEAERRDWEQLWADVDRLLVRIQPSK
jgi:serine/threonine-protein kinase